MKKILVILILFITGCTNNIKQDLYNSYLNELKSINTSTEIKNYNISVVFDRYSEDEIVYQVVIDKTINPLSNIQVLAYHNQETKDIYPSVGLFNDVYNLVPEAVAKDDVNIHGINLVGYIPYKGLLSGFGGTIKVLIVYNLDNNVNKDYYVYHFDNNN
jgi:hypothetical protein